jgi:pimeloyl-ACP methyl ester carboxylesterase
MRAHLLVCSDEYLYNAHAPTANGHIINNWTRFSGYQEYRWVFIISHELSLYNKMCVQPNTVLDMSYNMLGQDNIRRSGKKITAILLLLIFTTQIPSATADLPKSIRRIEISIELGEGVETNAQITYPALGEGPFPVVLLVPGGGLTDMDEYAPARVTMTGKPAAPMKQVADYLSERGFMVLRYNKRGVTRNATMANYTMYSMATVNTFKADAETALSVLRNNPMADNSDVTVIGHSESSIIVTRMAEDDPSISKIVMMGAAARDYLSIKHTQIVELREVFVKEILDINNDGLVSLEEAIAGMNPYDNAILPRTAILRGDGNTTSWIPTWDPNGDSVMNITEEYLPVLERAYSALLNPNYPGVNQTHAHVSWGATKDMIGGLQSSILILQGEEDWQTPLIEAVLLEQALNEALHKDHALFTYSGLSHFFYPTDSWETAIGPMEQYVLQDLYQWLVSPERILDQLKSETEKNKIATIGLEKEIETKIESVNLTLTQKIIEVENALSQEKGKGGESYVTSAFIVILICLIVTSRKRRIG